MINRRTVLMVLTSLLAAGSILWMQRKFEAADEKNALLVVQNYRAGGASLPELIAERHPKRPVEWSSSTESACFQHIRVHAVVTESAPAEPQVYAFTVDINGPVIHPANETGRDLMARLAGPPATPPASALPLPSASHSR